MCGWQDRSFWHHSSLRKGALLPAKRLLRAASCDHHRTRAGKVNFCTGTGRKAFFEFFFRPDSGPPPPGTYAFTAKKGKFICTGHFFPHGMAFLEKRGGLVPVYVFIFPEGDSSRRTCVPESSASSSRAQAPAAEGVFEKPILCVRIRHPRPPKTKLRSLTANSLKFPKFP